MPSSSVCGTRTTSGRSRGTRPARSSFSWYTAVYVSTTNDDTVPRRYPVYTPKTYSSRIFPSLNKFEDPFRLAVNDTRGSRDYLLFRLAETYLIAAEALMRDGLPAEGLPYINAVRRRAAIPEHETEMELTVDQLTLDAI